MSGNNNNGINIGGDFNFVGSGNTGSVNIGSGNSTVNNYSTQNISGSVYSIGQNYGHAGNVTNNYYFDWNAVSNELNTLRQYNAMLSEELQTVLDELDRASRERNEGGFLAICKKLSLGALDFFKNIGLSVIPQIIMHSMGI